MPILLAMAEPLACFAEGAMLAVSVYLAVKEKCLTYFL